MRSVGRRAKIVVGLLGHKLAQYTLAAAEDIEEGELEAALGRLEEIEIPEMVDVVIQSLNDEFLGALLGEEGDEDASPEGAVEGAFSGEGGELRVERSEEEVGNGRVGDVGAVVWMILVVQRITVTEDKRLEFDVASSTYGSQDVIRVIADQGKEFYNYLLGSPGKKLEKSRTRIRVDKSTFHNAVPQVKGVVVYTSKVTLLIVLEQPVQRVIGPGKGVEMSRYHGQSG